MMLSVDQAPEERKQVLRLKRGYLVLDAASPGGRSDKTPKLSKGQISDEARYTMEKIEDQMSKLRCNGVEENAVQKMASGAMKSSRVLHARGEMLEQEKTLAKNEKTTADLLELLAQKNSVIEEITGKLWVLETMNSDGKKELMRMKLELEARDTEIAENQTNLRACKEALAFNKKKLSEAAKTLEEKEQELVESQKAIEIVKANMTINLEKLHAKHCKMDALSQDQHADLSQASELLSVISGSPEDSIPLRRETNGHEESEQELPSTVHSFTELVAAMEQVQQRWRLLTKQAWDKAYEIGRSEGRKKKMRSCWPLSESGRLMAKSCLVSRMREGSENQQHNATGECAKGFSANISKFKSMLKLNRR